MNKITLTSGTYTTIHAIPTHYTMVYHTDENKALIAVVWNAKWNYFVRLYTKGENQYSDMLDLRAVSDFRFPTEKEAIEKANKLV